MIDAPAVHEMNKEQWARLIPTQESIAYHVQILQTNKILKERGIQALADCNSAK